MQNPGIKPSQILPICQQHRPKKQPVRRLAGLLLGAQIAVAPYALAQSQAGTQNLQTGWAAWFHSQQIGEKLRFTADVQLRSADEFDSLRNSIVRPGIAYQISKSDLVSLGYAAIKSHFDDAPDTLEAASWSSPMKENEPMMPTTVPKSPNNGARVISVLTIHMRASDFSISRVASSCMAASMEVWA